MNDCDIINDILEGNIDKYSLLVDKYADRVASVISKRVPTQERESVIQDIFLKAYRGLEGFDKNKPFENWLVTIAMRTCCDFWRKEGRNRNLDLSSAEEAHSEWLEKVEAAQSVDDFERNVSRQETLEVLDLVLNQLTPEDRMLIEMVYLEGWKLKDAAEGLKWTVSKTKVRAMRAREKMREHITNMMRN